MARNRQTHTVQPARPSAQLQRTCMRQLLEIITKQHECICMAFWSEAPLLNLMTFGSISNLYDSNAGLIMMNSSFASVSPKNVGGQGDGGCATALQIHRTASSAFVPEMASVMRAEG
jgi:hypothetical protein